MDRRRLLQYGAVAGAAVLTTAGRPVAGPARLRPAVGATTHRILDGLPAAPSAVAGAAGPPLEVGAFSALSFELPRAAAGLHVCTRSDRGWSPWTWLPAATDHGPDAQDPEPLARPRHVTELLWAPRADALQVATATRRDAAGLRAHLVHTTAGPVDDVGAVVGGVTGRVLGLLPIGDPPPEQPAIVRRRDWGADESWRRGRPRYATPERSVVHHTATSNGYRRGEVPGLLRSIYHHHARVRGWNDIGYNFLVDRFGRIFEGRHGGMDAGVVGAHARGHNTGSIGVAVLGDHRRTAPSAEARRAVAALLAWKYHVHEVPSQPSHRVRHHGRSYPATCGHRDTGTTSCPGGKLHEQLPAIRREIHERS